MRLLSVVLLLLSVILVSGCGEKLTEETKAYISEIEKLRKEKDEEMKNSPGSPFSQDTAAHWAPLHYYDVNPEFVFNSTVTPYPSADTVTVMGTKGEERKYVRYGYVTLNFRNKEYKMNVYKGRSRSGEEYAALWFTDETTNKTTYGVGRYLDFELNPDPAHVYTIDFNKAYNPYCAYSARFSCAVPNKEDHLAFEITAGEKKFHD